MIPFLKKNKDGKKPPKSTVQMCIRDSYLTGPVILVRTNMDGEFISLTIDQVYLFQKYLMRHSVTLMADGQKLPCICID